MARKDLIGVNDLSLIKPEDINSIGDKFGHELVNEGLKTNQVRNIYSSILSIRTKLSTSKDFNADWEESIHSELVLIKPKLAYAAGREKKVKPLYMLISDGIDGVVNSGNKEKALNNFIKIVEAVVAYHKFHGGKDK